jgi:hypothetical protein
MKNFPLLNFDNQSKHITRIFHSATEPPCIRKGDGKLVHYETTIKYVKALKKRLKFYKVSAAGAFTLESIQGEENIF